MTCGIDPLETEKAQREDKTGLVGPNSVTQLANALREQAGEAAVNEVFEGSGFGVLIEHPPENMIDERVPAALFAMLWRTRSDAMARCIAADAGYRTALYVLEHRIPQPAQILLRCMPRVLARRALLKAIEKNAWTFVGSGRCRTQPGRTAIIEILDNPLCMPGCVWHVAVFATLFKKLGLGPIHIKHPRCCAFGYSTCRFEIAFDAQCAERTIPLA